MLHPNYEAICQPLYDFQRIHDGRPVDFFCEPAFVNGRGLSDTNLYHANQLPGNNAFVVTGIGYIFSMSIPDDVRHGSLEFRIGSKTWHRVSFNHGESHASMFEDRAIYIQPGQSFAVCVTFDRPFYSPAECVLGIELYGRLYRPVA